jgi:hypothetical protein
LKFHDRSHNMDVEDAKALYSVGYDGMCVSLVGDALVNANPGYVFSFVACDLSMLGTGIATFSMSVTGPAGFLYQKSAALTAGYVRINP